MKRISLLRHAKAVDRTAATPDMDRPLTAKGGADAALIGAFLAEREHRPDLALSSPSTRTRETLGAVSARLPEPAQAVFNEAIYDGTAQDLLAAVQTSSDEFAHLLLVGHNPGIHEFALALAAPDGGRDMERLEKSFPKGALAEFEFHIASWREMEFAIGALTGFTRPKQLRR